MLVSAGLAAFAADSVRQNRVRADGLAQARRWLARADVRALDAALQAMSADPRLTRAGFAARLRRWQTDRAWLDDWMDGATALLRADPFADYPWQPRRTASGWDMALIASRHGQVTLSVLDAGAVAASSTQTLVLDSGFSLIMLLSAGTLDLFRYRLDRSADCLTGRGRVRLTGGACLHLDRSTEALVPLAASRDVLMVRIAVRPAAAGPRTREYAAATGRLLRLGHGDPCVSRMLALLPLIRDVPDDDALPLLGELAGHADPVLRWQAVREWVARAPAPARPAVAAMAQNDPDAALRMAAIRTLALIDQRAPQCRPPEPAPCRA